MDRLTDAERLSLSKLKGKIPELKLPLRLATEKGWGYTEMDRTGNKSRILGEVVVFDQVQNSSELFDDAETVKLLYIAKEKELSLHFHVKKVEIFYVAQGAIDLTVVHQGHRYVAEMKQHDNVFIPQGLVHSVLGVGDANILVEVSTQDDPKDSFRVIKGD